MKLKQATDKTKEKWKTIALWLTSIGMLITLALWAINSIGMRSFMFEETLQVQSFGYALPMMNKEWEVASAALWKEEPWIRANTRALRHTSRFNFISGDAFRAYANAVDRKTSRDKSFIKYMLEKEAKEKWERKIGLR